MLMETPTTRVRYGAGISATAIAHPGASSGYRTPSGALVGGMKSSLGHEVQRAEADGLRRYRSGPAVLEDYQLHEKGRLLGEHEALASLGADPSSSGTVTWDETATPATSSSGWGTWIGFAAVAALALSWDRK